MTLHSHTCLRAGQPGSVPQAADDSVPAVEPAAAADLDEDEDDRITQSSSFLSTTGD